MFSQRIANFGESTHNLFALEVSCQTVSSHDTYIICLSINEANCNDSVDLPIQGSPESKIRDQGTIPHHSTLFNSSDFVIILSSFWFVFSSFDKLIFSHFCFELVFDSLNSTKVFHSLQKLHCHCHLIASFQQLLQMYIKNYLVDNLLLSI